MSEIREAVGRGGVGPAAANNAAWCAALCRAHGLDTSTDGRRWWSSRRTPPYYPDAVTLDPTIDAAGVLEGIDTSTGCSVKDSFGTLDLERSGFHILFEAEWIYRPAAAARPSACRYEVVHDVEGLRNWTNAWGEGGAEIFVPALLDDPDVRLVSVQDGTDVVAVAVLNRAADVVGISNLVCTRGSAERAWDAVSDCVALEYPGLDLVGYEHGEDLAAATAAGFRHLGGLRIWAR